VLDVAHNPAGAWALRSALSKRYPDRPVALVFGIMRDKAVTEVIQILFPVAKHVIATHANNPRSASAEEIRAAGERITTNILVEQNVADALERACALLSKDAAAGVPGAPLQNGVVVVTGSIYIVGEALAFIEKRRRGSIATG
jgi:dihydrofolate synthase / folylpolyglutamate synthase